MIRTLQRKDMDTVCDIVNENWRAVYAGYVNPVLLTDAGCEERKCQLKKDFASKRLDEYVWEDHGQILAMLSIGDTKDADRAGLLRYVMFISRLRHKAKGSQPGWS